MAFDTSELPFELVQHLADPRGLLDQLHDRAIRHLFGEGTSTAAAASKALERLPVPERKVRVERIRRALRGRRAEKDDLESLASQHGVPHDRKTPADLLVLLLEEQLGGAKFDEEVERLLAPLDYKHRGTFATFKAPTLPTNVRAGELGHDIEQAVEKHLSRGRDHRKARVRAEANDDGFLVVVYFERPHLDGRKIDQRKRLRRQVFERPAADTFFWLRRLPEETRLVQRLSNRRLATTIRAALGEALWRDPNAVSSNPSAVYSLQAALETGFRLAPLPTSGVQSVALHEIEMRATSGTMLRLKASGESRDVLPELGRMVSLQRGARVTSMIVKLVVEVESDRTKVVQVTIRRSEITLDAAFMELVQRHLLSWGLVDG